ncbi:MAG: glycosyltransferase, partial [Bacteroidales bacterium]|nr:glycosyltransferase [Bacteroidales bacterium]
LAHIDKLAGQSVEIIWQTGTAFYHTAKTIIEDRNILNIRVLEFIHEMDFAYALANLVVCRSGAITLSELSLLGKPAILVPYPAAAENHQAKNAQAYVDAGASLLITDAGAPEKLTDAMLDLVNDRNRLDSMSLKMAGFAKPNAVNEIADEALKLIQNP